MNNRNKERNEEWDKEWDEKSLAAWNQWKSICSICGCPDEYRHILMIAVTNAFKKKLKSVIGKQLDSLFFDNDKTIAAGEENTEQNILPSQSGGLPSDGTFYPSEDFDEKNTSKDKDLDDLIPPEEDVGELNSDDEQSDNSDSDDGEDNQDDDMPDDVLLNDTENQKTGKKKEKLFRVDWAHEFDCGIIEKANSERSPKNYKDHTWACINRSDDPPLKIIRGQLLGPLGIINEIAERFLRNNFQQIWKKQVSLQAPVETGDTESCTMEDLIADKATSDSLDQSDKNCLDMCLRHLFSNDNAAIFLVYLTGFSTLFPRKISIAIPELQQYLGLSSVSSIYDRLNNVILPKVKGLPSECLQSMSIPGASDFLIFLLIEQIKPEKGAIPLLQIIKKGMVNSEGKENDK